MLMSLGVWLVIITVVYLLLCQRARDKIVDIKDIRDLIQNQLEVVVPCCINATDNCTCDNVVNGETLCWDSANNDPQLNSSMGNSSIVYVTCVPGNTTIDGISSWAYGDYARFVDSVSLWWKNEASGPQPAFTHEQYTFSISANSGGGLTVPPVTFSNWTVDMFLSNDFVLVHFPFWQAVNGLEDITCPPTNTCSYAKADWDADPDIPVNRRFDTALPYFPNHEVFADVSNCRAVGAGPDECQQCGGLNTTITIGAGQLGPRKYWLVNWDVDYFFTTFNLNQGDMNGCQDMYQASALYPHR